VVPVLVAQLGLEELARGRTRDLLEHQVVVGEPEPGEAALDVRDQQQAPARRAGRLDGRSGLAKWTAHEVMEDQLKSFFSGADKNSTAMKAISTARALSGGEEEKPKEKKETPQEAAARAARTDLPKNVAQDEEVTPTKLKTKMNLLKQNGSVVFTNPLATTEMNADKDEVSMNMHRDFRKIQVSSNLAYAIRQGVLKFNVNKKITERVSLDLDHYNYTGDHADGNGYKSREQARVNYSLSF